MSTAKYDGPRCGATTRTGEPCQQVAGYRTDHLGTGRCAHHGGASPSGIQAAAVELARQKAGALGHPIPMDPHEALAACVAISAGDVSFYRRMLAGLGVDELVGNPETRKLRAAQGESPAEEERVLHAVQPSVWLKQHAEAVRDLARHAKLAADAGVDERRTQLQEQRDADAAVLVRALVFGLGLSLQDARVRSAVDDALAQLGAAATTLPALEGAADDVPTPARRSQP